MFFKSIAAPWLRGEQNVHSRYSKTANLAILKPFRKFFKANPKTLFKTVLISGCFWCFISFTNRAFCIKRRKFPKSGRSFDPWGLEYFQEVKTSLQIFISLILCWFISLRSAASKDRIVETREGKRGHVPRSQTIALSQFVFLIPFRYSSLLGCCNGRKL